MLRLCRLIRDLVAMLPKRYRFVNDDGHYTLAHHWGLFWTWRSWSAPIVRATRCLDSQVRDQVYQVPIGGRGFAFTRSRMAVRASFATSDLSLYLDAYSTIPLQQTSVTGVAEAFDQGVAQEG